MILPKAMGPTFSKPGTPPAVMIVGGGPFQLPLVEAAQGLGLAICVVDRDPCAPAMMLADVPMAIDFGSPELVVRAAAHMPLSAVATCGSDAALRAVNAVAEAHGLVAPCGVEVCADKMLTAHALECAGVPHPESWALPTERDFDGPWVVKPRRGAGGRGVTVVRSVEEVPDAVHVVRALGAIPFAQRWVGGHPVGVELMMLDGQVAGAWVMDDVLRPGFAAPVAHTLPSALDEATQTEIIEVAASAARAVGLGSGPANLDMRLTDDGPVVLEINPRLGGSNISALIKHATGVDLPRATLLWALDRDPRPALKGSGRSRGASSRLILAEGDGIVRWPSSPPERAGVTVHVDVPSERPAPQQVGQWSILGRCVAVGEDAHTAAALAEQVTDQLEADIDLITREGP
ncbi:MAG: acetyl-CoA carboxylase biotin carboxylase subunit family protein [Bradymonadia bacterium]